MRYVRGASISGMCCARDTRKLFIQVQDIQYPHQAQVSRVREKGGNPLFWKELPPLVWDRLPRSAFGHCGAEASRICPFDGLFPVGGQCHGIASEAEQSQGDCDCKQCAENHETRPIFATFFSSATRALTLVQSDASEASVGSR